MIERYLMIPYRAGGSDWSGADCWGLVEIWYKDRLGLDIIDRRDIDSSPLGIEAGFQLRRDWLAVETPQNDDVVLMRAAFNGRRVEHGHVGVFWQGGVLHLNEQQGCTFARATSHLIASRISGVFRHKELA